MFLYRAGIMSNSRERTKLSKKVQSKKTALHQTKEQAIYNALVNDYSPE